MPELERMWVNQPSTRQPYHHLHGTLVLAFLEYGRTHRVYFLEGDVIDQQLPSDVLSKGWPVHLLDVHANRRVLRRLQRDIELGFKIESEADSPTVTTSPRPEVSDAASFRAVAKSLSALSQGRPRPQGPHDPVMLVSNEVMFELERMLTDQLNIMRRLVLSHAFDAARRLGLEESYALRAVDRIARLRDLAKFYVARDRTPPGLINEASLASMNPANVEIVWAYSAEDALGPTSPPLVAVGANDAPASPSRGVGGGIGGSD